MSGERRSDRFDQQSFLFGKIVDELRAPRCNEHANPLLNSNLRRAKTCPACKLLRGEAPPA